MVRFGCLALRAPGGEGDGDLQIRTVCTACVFCRSGEAVCAHAGVTYIWSMHAFMYLHRKRLPWWLHILWRCNFSMFLHHAPNECRSAFAPPPRSAAFVGRVGRLHPARNQGRWLQPSMRAAPPRTQPTIRALATPSPPRPRRLARFLSPGAAARL
jgi:hypothetical protein